MLFEVYNEKGIRLFYTSSKECLPPKEQINLMSQVGYKFKLDGKAMTSKKLIEQLKELNNGEDK